MTPEKPSDPELREVRTALGPMSFTDEGEGPALLALHGLPGSVRDFRWLAPALPGLRLLRLDLPGFGGTPAATCPRMDLRSRGAAVSTFLDAMGLDRVVVLGHSFGGALAAEVAAREPDRVVGLALVASVGVRPHRGRRSVRGWTALSLALQVAPVRRALLPRVREAYVKAGFPSSLGDDAIVRTVHGVAATGLERHRANLRGLRVSTLVAWTEDDPLVEPAISEELYWAAPHGPRIAFATGGHNLQKSRAVELGAAIGPWIGGLAR